MTSEAEPGTITSDDPETGAALSRLVILLRDWAPTEAIDIVTLASICDEMGFERSSWPLVLDTLWSELGLRVVAPDESTLVDGAAETGWAAALHRRGILHSGSLGFPLFDRYRAESRRIPLLTPRQEVRLGQTIEKGRAAAATIDRIGESTLARQDPERLATLRSEVARGTAAHWRLTVSNVRLVVSIAARYRASEVPLLDLIQEGNLGLLRAVDRFDWRKGYKFSTYATWWIRQAITRGIIDKGPAIRLPVHIEDQRSVVRRATRDLEEASSESPTATEIARCTGMTVERISSLANLPRVDGNLEGPASSGDTRSVLELIGDDNVLTPERALHESTVAGLIREAVATLDKRQIKVLTLRYGLDDGNPRTLEQVGALLGVTRERIRQIEGKALTHLRHPKRLEVLREAILEADGPTPPRVSAPPGVHRLVGVIPEPGPVSNPSPRFGEKTPSERAATATATTR